MTTKGLLSVTAAFEAATGVVLLAAPSVLAELLLGVAFADAVSMTVARVAGAALLALGVACWLERDEGVGRASTGLVKAMLVYNGAVIAVLVYAGAALGLIGIALWPAVLAHAVLAAWCIGWLSKRPLEDNREPKEKMR